MDNEAFNRIERKIDYIAGFLAGAMGLGTAVAVISLSSWGSWSEWVGATAAVILPVYLYSKYRDI